ncbi:MAG TPA: hypothetical protein VF545_02815, partial [Thermoleophilaceae bacterium]
MGDRDGRLAILRRRRAPLALGGGLAVVLVVVLLASGGDDRPPLVSGTPAEAVAAVDAFSKALAERDY